MKADVIRKMFDSVRGVVESACQHDSPYLTFVQTDSGVSAA